VPWFEPAAATVADLITNEPEAVTVEAETLPALTAPVTDAEAADNAPVTSTL
jgi:hypothetical protein